VQQIQQPDAYMYRCARGFCYLADWLPPVRRVALYQPYTKLYEMIRAGVFGAMVKIYGDPMHTTWFLRPTLVAVWLLREGHRYVAAE
jgi:hypothetical protein